MSDNWTGLSYTPVYGDTTIENFEIKSIEVLSAKRGSYSGDLVIPVSKEIQGSPFGGTFNVTGIGLYGFDDCVGITSVDFSENNYITAIPSIFSFCGCTGLTKVKFSSALKTISGRAFKDSPIESIEIDSENSTFYVESDCLIDKNAKSVILGCKYSVIPETVTTIGSYSFSSKGLRAVTIPSSVTTIGSYAFANNTEITSVTIPSSVKSISGEIFGGCSSLSYLKFEGNAPSASFGNPLSNTSALTEIHVNAGTTGWEETYYGKTVVVDGASDGDGDSGDGGDSGDSGDGGDSGGDAGGDGDSGGDTGGDTGGDETPSGDFREPRIIPMQCGDNEGYSLLFYESGDDKVKVDIYDATTKELVQTLDSPFPVGGIQGIRYCQSFDVMFFAQGDTYPCKLKRENKENEDGSSGYVFSFEDVEFTPEPVLDWENKSEHSISVFAIPDADLLVEDESGNKVFPKGSVREVVKKEELSFSYSYATYVDKFVFAVTVLIYAVAKTEKYAEYRTGTTLKLTTPVVVRLSNIDEIIYCVGYDGEPMTYSNLSATFTSGRVEKVENGCVYILCGKVRAWGDSNKSPGVTCISEGAGEVRYGDSQFYTAILDNVPESISVDDTLYYAPTTGRDFEVAMTVDGLNTNENLEVGQILALEGNNSLYESCLWDYESYPVGTLPNANPTVETLEVLASKTDSYGAELRPQTGGGFGMASEWQPVRGTVKLKTEGTWSGVIELQELDANGNVGTIAIISSENGLSNTSLERDIEDFGSCVRVACTRREYSYELRKSVGGDGSLYTHTFKNDDGCQWTLSSTDILTAYLRVTGKRTLSDGRQVYIVNVIGGICSSFTTNSYALGAWSKKNGYPEQVGIYQERLFYAGNKQKPTTVWLSRTNHWDDFELGTEDTSAMSFTLQTEKYDKFSWCVATKSYIQFGSYYGEWIFGESNGGVATATNGRFVNTSNIGGVNIPSCKVGAVMLMVKLGGQEIHRIDYNTLSEESAGTQVSMLARHLFEKDEVKDMFAVRSPMNTIYILCKSGKLVSFTYEPEYDVAGWARHEILDGVVCAASVRRSGKDVLVFIVKKGERYLLGEIDPSSDVWTDDGEPYESELIPTPFSSSGGTSGGAYGSNGVFAGVDVYVVEGSRFNVKLSGGDEVRVDNGFMTDGSSLNGLERRVSIPASSGWEEEVLIDIKTDYPAPLVISAIGAAIRGGSARNSGVAIRM